MNTVTMAQNRELRQLIDMMTTGCFLTVEEFAQILNILCDAAARSVEEVQE